MEIHKLAIEAGVYDPEYAQRQEGIMPGSIETAPIPPAPPAAIPAPIEARSAPTELRCDGMTAKRRSGVSRIERCNRLLSKAGEFVGTCPRCKKVYAAVAA
jgi:hypothetical protein